MKDCLINPFKYKQRLKYSTCIREGEREWFYFQPFNFQTIKYNFVKHTLVAPVYCCCLIYHVAMSFMATLCLQGLCSRIAQPPWGN